MDSNSNGNTGNSNPDSSASSSIYRTPAESPNLLSMYSDIDSTSITDSNDDSNDGDNVLLCPGQDVDVDYDSVTDVEEEEGTPRPTTVLTNLPSSTMSSNVTSSTFGTITIDSIGGKISRTSTPSTLKRDSINSDKQTRKQMDFSPPQNQEIVDPITRVLDMVDDYSASFIHVVDAIKVLELKMAEIRTFIDTNLRKPQIVDVTDGPFLDTDCLQKPQLQLPSSPPNEPTIPKKAKVSNLRVQSANLMSGVPKVVRTPIRSSSASALESTPQTVIKRVPKSTSKHNLSTEDVKFKLRKLPAMVKGYLTRRLMSTEKVKDILWTLSDTAKELAAFVVPDDPCPADIDVHGMMMTQLVKSQEDFLRIMTQFDTKDQLALISTSRECIKATRPVGVSSVQMAFSLQSIIRSPRPVSVAGKVSISNATMKRFQRKSGVCSAASSTSSSSGRGQLINPGTVTKKRMSSTLRTSSAGSTCPRQSIESLRTKGAVSRMLKQMQPQPRPVPEPRPRKSKNRITTTTIKSVEIKEEKMSPTIKGGDDVQEQVSGIRTRLRSNRRRTHSLSKSVVGQDNLPKF